jgi:peptide/nickel transport system ATP-binding protein
MKAQAGPAILEIRDLNARLDPSRRLLLEGLNFSIFEGEVLGLVGQSGSGKSLTSLAIIGLLPRAIRADGSIKIQGQEIIGAHEKTLNKIRGTEVSIIFQEPTAALDPLMKLGAQIALPLKKHTGLRGAKLRGTVFSLMEEVKLNDIERIARSFPHEISGGQRQRAAVALALACSPKLLIADEPTSATDASIQKQLVELIYETAAIRKIAVLFISHDIGVVHKIADRIMVMKDGNIVETADSEEIIRNPRHSYTRLLINAARQLEKPFKQAAL